MKHNIITVLIASLMIILVTGALFLGMTMYERDLFDENWRLTPTVIEKELTPLYSEELDETSKEY